MSLSFEERNAAVERLTAASHASPSRYRLRVIAWIVLGYVLIGGFLTISLAACIGAVWILKVSHSWGFIKIVWIPLAFAWAFGRALFVRLDPPVGRVLKRHEAPRLFATLDEIHAYTRVPRLDGVLIVDDMNAAVVETPRFGGLFGWHRHLLLGLPLMLTHSAEEMKAVLGHELGHLSGRHGRVAGWSWRVRVTWARVIQSLDARRGFVAGQLQKVMHWYVERLMLVTLVLARGHEHAADDVAAELTSRETAARALAWVDVAGQLLDRRFWKTLWARMPSEPQPPHPLHELLVRRREVLAAPYGDALEEALQRNTAPDDTHPALRERLARLGVPRPELAPAAVSAAEEYFGRSAASLIAESDRQWQQVFAPVWKERHQALAAAAQVVDDASVDLHRRADSLADLGRDEEALPLYEELFTRDPGDARAAFQLGRILVQRGDLAGLPHLQKAAERDWKFVQSSCELAYNALRAKGRDREADEWTARYQQHMARIEAAQAEMSSLGADDRIVPADLPEEVQEHILDRCREAGWVGEVWIARKELTSIPTSVNFVALKAKFYRFAGGRNLRKLVASLNVQQELMLFVLEGSATSKRLNLVLGARRSL